MFRSHSRAWDCRCGAGPRVVQRSDWTWYLHEESTHRPFKSTRVDESGLQVHDMAGCYSLLASELGLDGLGPERETTSEERERGCWAATRQSRVGQKRD